MNRKIFFTALFFLLVYKGKSQNCPGPSQTPQTAYPVCGIHPFSQESLANCPGQTVPSTAGCVTYSSDNSFWYKFHCYGTGTLGFIINGANVDDDYDWEVFDVTGHQPGDVYTNSSLQVSLNLYGVSAANPPYPNTPTGCSNSGFLDKNCEGQVNSSPFNRMPTIISGHDYLLMVTNYSASGRGYTLNFTGGTANITAPLSPALLVARAPCDGTLTTVKLNKAMRCDSLSADGSEFVLVPPIANVVAAVGVNCSQSFDMDSVNLTLDAPLPPGNYFIQVKKGIDGNTLVDNCGLSVPEGNKVPLTIYPVVPTAMDSLTNPRCAPDTVQLVFTKRMFCNSIEPGGSDFVLTGPDAVTVIGAAGLNCSDGLSDKIIVKLSKPLQLGGIYTLTLVTGTDGNTLLNECGKETPAGQSVSFNVADTVNADFTYNIIYGCVRDTIQYFHDGRNGVNKWSWNFDKTRQSKLQNPLIPYGSFGEKMTQLIVSNGVCTDTSAWMPIVLDNTLAAAFTSLAFVCPNESATFVDNSVGKQITWRWNFDNGNTSTLQQPPAQTYPFAFQFDRTVKPQLVITDAYGCTDTATNTILIPNSCFIDVPNAFTPNGDGINDYLYPLAAYKSKDLLFRVYNRFGQLVFEGHNWSEKWNGTFKGQPADAATYVWTLHYINTETGAVIDRRGSSILIR